jgi:hypothetical protein
MKLHEYPLLAAYCGGAADESACVTPEHWAELEPDVPYPFLFEAHKAEAELVALGLTPATAWRRGYDLDDPRGDLEAPTANAICNSFF